MTQTTRTQDLREAFASIITMMLGLLRAQGLRGLLQLPALWLATREMRRLADAFCELFAAFQAGTLTPVPAAPDRQPAPPCATPRVAARPATPRHRRPRQPACARPVLATVRAPTRATPRTIFRAPLPAPHALVRATDPQKIPLFRRCLRTSNSLRYRNERAAAHISGQRVRNTASNGPRCRS
jgi:hypothetical protein